MYQSSWRLFMMTIRQYFSTFPDVRIGATMSGCVCECECECVTAAAYGARTGSPVGNGMMVIKIEQAVETLPEMKEGQHDNTVSGQPWSGGRGWRRGEGVPGVWYGRVCVLCVCVLDTVYSAGKEHPRPSHNISQHYHTSSDALPS